MDRESLCLRPSPFASPSGVRVLASLRELVSELLSGGAYTAHCLVEALEVPRGGRVLDVGTGRGVLPFLLLGARPDLTVIGVDAESGTLRQARRHAARAHCPARFGTARAECLPFPPRQFDAVVSTLLLHHLPSLAKSAACREFARVLTPHGTCYLADFAPARTTWARWAGIIPRLTCFPHIGENFRGRVPHLLREAGFVAVEEVYQTAASVSLYRARLSART
jgi:ubiquinone/menaquinone biosynthesis C-methylase UbiE